MFQSPDFYEIDKLLNSEQILVRDSIRGWVNENISPIIEKAFLDGKFPRHLIGSLADIGAFGGYLPYEYGGSNLDFISYGLMMQELERGDSSLRVLSSIQSSLVIKSIYEYGSENQKKKYLIPLTKGNLIGSFGMTEPDHGSDPRSMKTHYKEKDGYYIINGSKMWIGQAPICDLAIVWAKDKKNNLSGFIVDRKTEGFSTSEIKNKLSYRSSITGELIFNNMKVPKENLLHKCKSFKDLYKCLNLARYSVSWGALGIAMECYDVAHKYSMQRKQFGKEISSFQLIQKKLTDMLVEITKAQVLLWRLGSLMNEGVATYEQISLAKLNNVKMACDIARISRSILGGMGITNEYPIMRHLINLETIVSYLGTDEIQTLILGRKITGISALV